MTIDQALVYFWKKYVTGESRKTLYRQKSTGRFISVNYYKHRRVTPRWVSDLSK